MEIEKAPDRKQINQNKMIEISRSTICLNIGNENWEISEMVIVKRRGYILQLEKDGDFQLSINSVDGGIISSFFNHKMDQVRYNARFEEIFILCKDVQSDLYKIIRWNVVTKKLRVVLIRGNLSQVWLCPIGLSGMSERYYCYDLTINQERGNMKLARPVLFIYAGLYLSWMDGSRGMILYPITTNSMIEGISMLLPERLKEERNIEDRLRVIDLRYIIKSGKIDNVELDMELRIDEFSSLMMNYKYEVSTRVWVEGYFSRIEDFRANKNLLVGNYERKEIMTKGVNKDGEVCYCGYFETRRYHKVKMTEKVADRFMIRGINGLKGSLITYKEIKRNSLGISELVMRRYIDYESELGYRLVLMVLTKSSTLLLEHEKLLTWIINEVSIEKKSVRARVDRNLIDFELENGSIINPGSRFNEEFYESGLANILMELDKSEYRLKIPINYSVLMKLVNVLKHGSSDVLSWEELLSGVALGSYLMNDWWYAKLSRYFKENSWRYVNTESEEFEKAYNTVKLNSMVPSTIRLDKDILDEFE